MWGSISAFHTAYFAASFTEYDSVELLVQKTFACSWPNIDGIHINFVCITVTLVSKEPECLLVNKCMPVHEVSRLVLIVNIPTPIR